MVDSSLTHQTAIVYYKYSLILSKHFIETNFKYKLCKIKSECLKTTSFYLKKIKIDHRVI